MGAKDSKRACLSYEDAVKRVSDVEFRRVCEAFKRLAGSGNTIGKDAFTYDVLGECVPSAIADWLYTACGGTTRGIALRELICGLVLLTRGTQEEKIKFLWTLYCNESGSWIIKNDFNKTLKLEQSLRTGRGNHYGDGDHYCSSASLFSMGQDKVGFEQFRLWLTINKDGTGLSRWLLLEPCVSLSSELEMPTFYQTLAGVTHLEEHDISELEKCFWALQNGSSSDQLDLTCISPLVSPPIPQSVCAGFFLALDENRDGHIDFKELCCGVSAACRGPMAERMKFCFKVFDVDRDGKLNPNELKHMAEVLELVSKENEQQLPVKANDLLKGFENQLVNGCLSQEDFLIWGVRDGCPSQHFLELLFEVCHVALGLRPQCRHNEHDIVTKWLAREERRGYCVGQFWYLISSTWWRSWLSYTSTRSDSCTCRPVEEGIACDESFTSNSTESMGDLLGRGGGDTSSIASSSGVSSSSGSCTKRSTTPGPIDNTALVAEPMYKVATLTGEGGRLKRDLTLAQHRDFELVPDSLWKALALWYGGPLPLPRQVIRPPGSSEVDLELYPLNLRILRHQSTNQNAGGNGTASAWSGYGSAVGLTSNNAPSVPRRYLAHTAAFSRLACVRQVGEFLAQRLVLRIEDIRLWHVPNSDQLILLEDENISLQDLGISDDDQILLEVRNKDLTWPEELSALCTGGQERRVTSSPPPGATGLHNLGNTCFMNAALQAVSNTRPLNQYFSKDMQLCEINSNNPLGTRGQLARRYGELCRELWGGSGQRSIAPLKLRWCVTKHAPHLAGGGQHDSQELLAWLLDALHEDLNRVAVSPYTELKDSDGRPDCEVAKEAWDQHLARNKSIIIDLFHGQLKSKVTCQTCGHESVRFDPFSMLSLPLPMESFTLCEVLVIRLDASIPIKYGLRLNSEATYLELKKHLQPMCGINPEHLLLAEISNSQLKYLPVDSHKLKNANVIELFAYEMPSTDVHLPDVTHVTTQPTKNSTKEILASTNSSSNGCKVNSTLLNGGKDITSSVETSAAQNQGTAESTNNCQTNTRSNSIQLNENHLHPTCGKQSSYIVAIHRKMVRQEAYFLSQHKCKPIIFGVPLLLGYKTGQTTCQELYEAVWAQVTRLLSPMPQTDQTNHATDCDDSLGYEFPFTLCIVGANFGNRWCGLCPWNKFCRGCHLPCRSIPVSEAFNMLNHSNSTDLRLNVAIDWDQTALHLRYQNSRERAWIEDDTVKQCRKKHTEPIDLDHCLSAFTSEERLEEKYHCSSCKSSQPATKKLQIWRLPPILVVHLKRFDCVNGKWVKTQKVVNFPFSDFDPTGYLASVPQETILRHRELRDHLKQTSKNTSSSDENVSQSTSGVRERLISTSLRRTPVDDEDLQDFHQHHLAEGQDPFDMKYQLYAVVSHSGMLNGGHYICYACNPNGSWYCYNDSSCREVARALDTTNDGIKSKIPNMDTSSAYILFYERSGLNYTPYFPDTSNGSVSVQDTDSDDGDTDPRKNCVIS
ncbi:ubiquitin carboxyl-terminal hydrolase 32 isoform X2 [Chrysoperla carnea]|uniref:ubiquitin carboxyl-terminal hydrolase 32 isoform X2 n=1 Tax=Chrysoperla carnea TaxID=189513 RepID=UPI001D072C7F|nr:ubiquitin carboxyl-terminal hydrolase 32 isoform X2 [Chrysoperla carnea]